MKLDIIIVEDELAAAENLRLILKDIAPDINVLAILPSIEKSLEWLSTNKHPNRGHVRSHQGG